MISTTDLMRNDCVRTTDGKYLTVDVIYSRNVICRDSEGNYNIYSERDLSPVYITEQMMETNGFTYICDEYPSWNLVNENFLEFKEVPPYDEHARYELHYRMGNRVIQIDSVHRLQHFLRIYGLEELANQFVVDSNNMTKAAN